MCIFLWFPFYVMPPVLDNVHVWLLLLVSELIGELWEAAEKEYKVGNRDGMDE